MTSDPHDLADSAADRLASLTSWHHDWSGLKVAVLGLGVTGFSAADTLAELGAAVVVVAQAADPSRARLLEVIGAELVEADLASPPERLVEFSPELIIVSPGFAPTHPLLVWAESEGIPLWGDIELAWRLRDKVGEPADWILVTGTNGKTTTVQLTAAMLLAGGHRVAPCGNIGVPVLDAIRDPLGFDVLVVELSSYQLHFMNRNPGGYITGYASVVLNVADDHLDWHGSVAAYRAAKARVYDGTRVACVYNRADESTRVMVEEADVQEGARAIGFGLDVPGPSDFGIVDGILCDRAFLDDRRNQALELTTVDALDAHGLGAPHVVADVLAASALARSYGVEPQDIRDALEGFHLDEHRVQVVVSHREITWVDDSKATNAHAADASLKAFPSVVWIVGGLLKGIDLTDLVITHRPRLRAVIIIGENRDTLRELFRQYAPDLPLAEVDAQSADSVMADAVRLAADFATTGDVVLLAPSAASMDQFADYGDRGRRFAAAVRHHLADEAPEEQAP